MYSFLTSMYTVPSQITPKGKDCYINFTEFYKHPQVPRSLPKGTSLYISIFKNILTSSLLFPASLVLYPLIYICFLPFCMCCSTPSPTHHTLYLWLLLWVCFSRPFLPNTQFPVWPTNILKTVGDGQGGLACCKSWGRKELDTTELLNQTELTPF